MSGIFKALGGDLFESGVNLVKHFFPGKMSEEQESQAQFAAQQMANSFVAQAQSQFDSRVKELEGTAKDLQQSGVVGRIIVFLRGVQRPAWGFATLYIDYQWFAGLWVFNEAQSNAVYLINLLVLGFLFGERTIKNLEPLLLKIFAK